MTKKDSAAIADLSKLSYHLKLEAITNKYHEGAVLDKSNEESKYDRRLSKQEKNIGWLVQKDISYIEEGGTIYLNNGITTYQLAKLLKNISNIRKNKGTSIHNVSMSGVDSTLNNTGAFE